MRKVRWGIVSTAKIGIEKVIPAMQRAQLCDVVAIASRTLDKARQAAGQLGIAKAYGSYEELLADPEIDAIILRIDSPGGSPTASDAIYRQIVDFKKKTGVPYRYN